MANIPMADSIASVPEFAGWYNAIKAQLAEIDLGKLFVYVVDDVDKSALYYLAEQFDVLGYKGLRLAQTDDDKRQLIKRAIELHRYKGTEWAIIEALKSIGFSDIALEGGIAAGFDHWAKFRVRITNQNLQLSNKDVQDILEMVKEYKRAVCVLVEILLTFSLEDTLDVTDDAAQVNNSLVSEDLLQLTGVLFYDGTSTHDGTHDYSGDGDIVSITQI